jgi:hypothetical protein
VLRGLRETAAAATLEARGRTGLAIIPRRRAESRACMLTCPHARMQLYAVGYHISDVFGHDLLYLLLTVSEGS